MTIFAALRQPTASSRATRRSIKGARLSASTCRRIEGPLAHNCTQQRYTTAQEKLLSKSLKAVHILYTQSSHQQLQNSNDNAAAYDELGLLPVGCPKLQCLLAAAG